MIEKLRLTGLFGGKRCLSKILDYSKEEKIFINNTSNSLSEQF